MSLSRGFRKINEMKKSSNKNATCGKKIRWTYINDKRMAHTNHPFIVYFFLDLLLVASKLTFRRNSTISSGESGRSTETQ